MRCSWSSGTNHWRLGCLKGAFYLHSIADRQVSSAKLQNSSQGFQSQTKSASPTPKKGKKIQVDEGLLFLSSKKHLWMLQWAAFFI